MFAGAFREVGVNKPLVWTQDLDKIPTLITKEKVLLVTNKYLIPVVDLKKKFICSKITQILNA